LPSIVETLTRAVDFISTGRKKSAGGSGPIIRNTSPTVSVIVRISASVGVAMPCSTASQFVASVDV
jgi:hypothetical protein